MGLIGRMLGVVGSFVWCWLARLGSGVLAFFDVLPHLALFVN
jgi:hypothetical protein